MLPSLEKMMATRGYNLLKSEDVPSVADDDLRGRQGKARELAGRVKPLAIWLFILISVGANFVFLIKSGQQTDIGRSPFSESSQSYYLRRSHNVQGGLGYDTPTVFRSPTDWWGDNESLADELWEHIDTSPMAIALTDEYARSHDLPIASRFPWDDDKGTYFIKAFHQLHCLVSILIPLRNLKLY